MSDHKNEGSATVRKNVALPVTVWDRVQDYRFGNRIGSESKALRLILEKGLAALAAENAAA